MKTFKQYLESQGKSQSTIKHYESYILDFISYLDKDNTAVEQATAKEVLSYLNHLQKKGQQNKTRSIRLGVIKHYFKWQLDGNQRTDNPIQHLKIRGTKGQKLYPILTRQDLDKLYTHYQVPTAQDPRNNRNWFTTYQLTKQRNKVILSLMIHQGLTTAEVGKLQLNDLKLREGELCVQGSRKSNERTLPLQSHQMMDLMEYTYKLRPELLSYQADPSTENLFLSLPTAGKLKSNKETLSVWKGLTKELKKQHSNFINFKQVRASVITHWLKRYNLRQVQYMAGHRYVSSTEQYLVNQTEGLQTDIDKFHPIG